jgi:hypothetical protein
MRVVARPVDVAIAPPELAGLVTPGQVFLTSGQAYAVFAIAVFKGRTTLQVIDDLKYPAWLPAWLFDVVDPTVPSDWICNVFHDDPVLVAGPTFVAKDQEAHARMVELEPHEVDLFWKRVQALPEETGSEPK